LQHLAFPTRVRHRGQASDRRAGSVKPADSIVFVVDDDASMREALAGLIRSVGFRVETFEQAEDFLEQRRPDTAACLVLDVRLRGLGGLDLQRMLAARGDHIPIIFITAHGDIPMSVRAMKAGAVEFLPKPFREQELLDAIGQALERDEAGRRRRAELGDLRERYALLTARERQVAGEIAGGALNKQVAHDLGVSEMTVKVYRRHIMEKMQARSLAQLVMMVAKLS
jgi:FixJ family two-component response regulator